MAYVQEVFYSQRKEGIFVLFHRRSCHPFLKIILVLFGVKWLKENKPIDEATKKEWKAKRKLFRRKIQEAFSVWDDDESSNEQDASTIDKGASM